jgi:hypothetical protein
MLAAAEAVAVVAMLTAAGRSVALVVVIALKLVLCWGAWQGRAGAILTLLLWEGTTVIAMVAGDGIHLALRLLGGVVAAVAAGLLLAGSGHVAEA